MKGSFFLRLLLALVLLLILVPAGQILLWSVAERWPWPGLLPESYSLRTVKELLFGSAKLPGLLGSSITLALTVGVLGTVVGLLTARATQLYDFPGKELVSFGPSCPCWSRGRYLPWAYKLP